MNVKKVTYTESKDFDLPAWMTLQAVYVLMHSFLAVYEAEVDDEKGSAIKMLLRIEYPKSLLKKFKRHFGLS